MRTLEEKSNYNFGKYFRFPPKSIFSIAVDYKVTSTLEMNLVVQKLSRRTFLLHYVINSFQTSKMSENSKITTLASLMCTL